MRLRNCLYHFAPYGFHATWHHLTTTHHIPGRIEADPSSLVRALDELETPALWCCRGQPLSPPSDACRSGRADAFQRRCIRGTHGVATTSPTAPIRRSIRPSHCPSWWTGFSMRAPQGQTGPEGAWSAARRLGPVESLPELRRRVRRPRHPSL